MLELSWTTITYMVSKPNHRSNGTLHKYKAYLIAKDMQKNNESSMRKPFHM